MSHSNSNLVAVVVRQLKNNRPVVSKVILQSDDKTVDNQFDYLVYKADEHINGVRKTFVELYDANWYIEIIDTDTDEIVKSVHYTQC